jgi:N,N'-diacetyllegionaminate synthase
MKSMENKIFVCAEAGHNHMGYMRHAKLLIEEAKACGADAVKFQFYSTDRIKKPWQSRYFELLLSEHTKEEAAQLKAWCDEIGIEFMASAFDIERLGWLEELGVKRHKIASRSIYEQDMIEAMEATGKPLIASLGKLDKRGIPDIKNADYLFCISEYPTYMTPEMFPVKFGKDEQYQGFSDHTIGMYWAREAAKRGATIIEKHFTLSRDLPGHDQKGSADPTELKDFVIFCRQIERGIND